MEKFHTISRRDRNRKIVASSLLYSVLYRNFPVQSMKIKCNFQCYFDWIGCEFNCSCCCCSRMVALIGFHIIPIRFQLKWEIFIIDKRAVDRFRSGVDTCSPINTRLQCLGTYLAFIYGLVSVALKVALIDKFSLINTQPHIFHFLPIWPQLRRVDDPFLCIAGSVSLCY